MIQRPHPEPIRIRILLLIVPIHTEFLQLTQLDQVILQM